MSPIPADLLDEATTLTGALEVLAATVPDHVALTLFDRNRRAEPVSIGAIWRRALEVCATLKQVGLRRGRVVLLVLPTGRELLSAYFGTILAGGIPGLLPGPTNRFSDARTYGAHVASIAAHGDAGVLYADEDVAPILRQALGGGGDDRFILTSAACRSAAPERALCHPAPEEASTIQYSSGSTGSPKGVLLSSRAILNNLRAMRTGLGLTPDDVSVNWLPLYHDMGLIDAFLLPLLGGFPAVLIPTMDFMRDPSLWLRAIERYGGTFSIAPNFAYAFCARRIPDSELEGLDLSTWRIAISASEPVLADTIAAFTGRFSRYGFRPETMTPAWGLAEGVCVITASPVDAIPRIEHLDRVALATENVARPTSDGMPSVCCGPCLPECELEIRDESGRRLPERHVGLLWLRSNSLSCGYHRDADLTAELFVDGWLNTGDRGYLADGCLYFVSREKDLIVIGGEKYAPHDVEEAINRVPGVRAGCAVAFGFLNEARGTEDVAAVVETNVVEEGAKAALGDAIRAEVARSTGLALRWVILVPPGDVAKTTSGKLARRATRQRYGSRLV